MKPIAPLPVKRPTNRACEKNVQARRVHFLDLDDHVITHLRESRTRQCQHWRDEKRWHAHAATRSVSSKRKQSAACPSFDLKKSADHICVPSLIALLVYQLRASEINKKTELASIVNKKRLVFVEVATVSVESKPSVEIYFLCFFTDYCRLFFKFEGQRKPIFKQRQIIFPVTFDVAQIKWISS